MAAPRASIPFPHLKSFETRMATIAFIGLGIMGAPSPNFWYGQDTA